MRIALALGSLLTLAGCGAIDASNEVLSLKYRVQFLEKENSRISNELIALTGRISTPSTKRDVAYLDPAGDTSYQYLETNVSPLLVSYVGAQPVGDSTRITLKLGNMAAATFSGANLQITYGPRAPKEGGEGLIAWSESLRTTEAKVVSELYSGKWNLVTASLPEIKPDQLGYVSVKANLDVVALR